MEVWRGSPFLHIIAGPSFSIYNVTYSFFQSLPVL